MANKEAKAPLVDKLADRLGRSTIAIVTDYRGLTVAEMMDLRRKLRAANVEYQVAKNTLTRFAAERAEKTAITQDLVGPTAIAFAYDDPAAAAKVLRDYLRSSRVLKIKGAVLGDRRLEPEDLQNLADLPARPQLQARLVGTLAGPMAGIVGTINGLLSQLCYVLDQRAAQLGEGSGSAPEASALEEASPAAAAEQAPPTTAAEQESAAAATDGAPLTSTTDESPEASESKTEEA